MTGRNLRIAPGFLRRRPSSARILNKRADLVLQINNEGRVVPEQCIEVEGTVTTVLPGTMFRVELDNKHLVLATISGKMRKKFVRLTVGDRVKMEMSPYDLDKARITWRLR